MIADYQSGRPVVLRPITLPCIAGPAGEPPVRLGYAEIDFHKSEYTEDPRPRVNVAFLALGEPVMFSLIFDSGSDKSHILSAVPPASVPMSAGAGAGSAEAPLPTTLSPAARKIAERNRRRAAREEAYRYDDASGRQSAGARVLTYGTVDTSRNLGVVRRIREMVELVGSRDKYSHLIEMDLTNATDGDHTGIGLFGAGRSSHFAEAARSFTFRPAKIAGGAGMILIGERNEAVITQKCERRSIQWFPNMLDVSTTHWTVKGSTTFEGETDPVKWMIDTGAAQVYLPQAAYDRLNATLQALGSRMEILHKQYPLIHNCTGWKTRFPSFNITFGSLGHHDALTITITPEDYVLWPSRDESRCYHRIYNGPVANMPGVRLIGMVTLNKLVSVFDREHDRMGFCKIAL